MSAGAQTPRPMEHKCHCHTLSMNGAVYYYFYTSFIIYVVFSEINEWPILKIFSCMTRPLDTSMINRVQLITNGFKLTVSILSSELGATKRKQRNLKGVNLSFEI